MFMIAEPAELAFTSRARKGEKCPRMSAYVVAKVETADGTLTAYVLIWCMPQGLTAHTVLVTQQGTFRRDRLAGFSVSDYDELMYSILKIVKEKHRGLTLLTRVPFALVKDVHIDLLELWPNENENSAELAETTDEHEWHVTQLVQFGKIVQPRKTIGIVSPDNGLHLPSVVKPVHTTKLVTHLLNLRENGTTHKKKIGTFLDHELCPGPAGGETVRTPGPATISSRTARTM